MVVVYLVVVITSVLVVILVVVAVIPVVVAMALGSPTPIWLFGLGGVSMVARVRISSNTMLLGKK